MYRAVSYLAYSNAIARVSGAVIAAFLAWPHKYE
jgi:hypothetical protein